MFENISDVITNLLSTISYVLIINICLRDKKKRDTLSIIAVYAIFCVLNMVINHVFKQNMMIKTITIIILSLIIIYCSYNVRIYIAIASSLLAFMIGSLTDSIAFAIIKMQVADTSKMSQTEEVTGRYIVIASYLVLFLLEIVYLTISDKRIFTETDSKSWIFVVGFSIYSILTVGGCIKIFANVKNNSDLLILYGITCGLVIMDYFMYALLKYISEKNILIRQQEADAIRNELIYEKSQLIVASAEKQHKLMHDYKSHMECINLLVRENKYDSLKDYISGILWKSDVDMYYNTNNIIVDNVLNNAYARIKRLSVALSSQLCDMSGLRIDDSDVVILLSNLMNNAIEACERDTAVHKYIHIKFKREEDSLFIEISNSYDGNSKIENGKIMTTKIDDNYIHGLGISNIHDVVNKYNGDINIKTENNDFTVSICIPQAGEAIHA